MLGHIVHQSLNPSACRSDKTQISEMETVPELFCTRLLIMVFQLVCNQITHGSVGDATVGCRVMCSGIRENPNPS